MNEFNLKVAVADMGVKNSLDVQSVIDILKESFARAIAEIYNLEEDEVVVNVEDEGLFKIGTMKTVVDKVENPLHEVSLEEAKKLQKKVTLGDDIEVPINLKTMDRRNMKFLNDILQRSFTNLDKETSYKTLKAKEDTLVTGIIVRKNNRDYFVDIAKNVEARFPIYEQNPRDVYKIGEKMKFLLKEVAYDNRDRLSVTLSRSDVNFVKRLFEMEVPELVDGTVRFHNIVRDAGKKVKMAVYATKQGVEPVGTCVGFSGVRIKEVIRELSGEKIDVIPYMEDTRMFLERSLQPAKVNKLIIIDNERKEAVGIVDAENYPLAVGRAGININLACQLTGWRINLKTIEQIEKHPEVLESFSRVEKLSFRSLEGDLSDLVSIKEETLLKLMQGGITSISDLYERSKTELVTIEGITEKDVMEIRRVLEEVVEVVDNEMDIDSANEAMSDYEDSIQGIDTNEVIEEEEEEVEVLVCPSCGFEFEYVSQTKCPSCGIEFEFEEE